MLNSLSTCTMLVLLLLKTWRRGRYPSHQYRVHQGSPAVEDIPRSLNERFASLVAGCLFHKAQYLLPSSRNSIYVTFFYLLLKRHVPFVFVMIEQGSQRASAHSRRIRVNVRNRTALKAPHEKEPDAENSHVFPSYINLSGLHTAQ